MSVNKFSAWLSTFIFCFLFWMLLIWSVEPRELILGVVFSAVVAAITCRFFVHNRAFFFCNPIRLLTLVFYCCVIFLWEVIKANISMVALVLSRDLKNYNPGLIRIPAKAKHGSIYGQAFVSNCITLTPGTITMDVAQDEDGENYYYVHWVNVTETDREKAGDMIKGTMEKWIGRI